MEAGNGKLLKLGIAADYPVNWNFERILRDLIQNFYDSIGCERFQKEFDYSWRLTGDEATGEKRIELTLKTIGHSFHYDWLVYLGGTTKTADSREYTGKYGEGFKICMLCLLKECIQVSMHSQDWLLHPCLYNETIDRANVRMLGYVYGRVKDDGITELKLSNIPRKYERLIKEGLLHFFYKENPLFGEKLYESERGVIFRNSGHRIPAIREPEFYGILYVHCLARGRLPFPLFIQVNSQVSADSRKRSDLCQYDILKLVYQLFQGLSGQISFQLLEILRSYWNVVPKSKKDACSWYFVICQLVRNVGLSESETRKFKKKYPNLAYIERKGHDTKRNQIIEQTSVWAREHNTKDLVNPVFRLLGAVSLVEQFVQQSLCGMREPDACQRQQLALLFDVCEKILPFAGLDPLPQLWIGSYEESRKDPLRFARKAANSKTKLPHQKYILTELIFSEEDFLPEAFNKTLVFLGDTLLHIYGSSTSERMNGFATMFAACLIRNPEIIMQAKTNWEKLSLAKAE